MARCLDPVAPATVLDPACGRGDLLVAAVDEFGTHGIHYVGIDKDPKALRVCELELAVRGADASLYRADFFDSDLFTLTGSTRNVHVTMNPPFRGYGHLSRRTRKALLHAAPDLSGRYNLAHAFLVKILTQLRPKSVVALLPGTWPKAAYNHLGYLTGLPRNSWKVLPESTFRSATTTAGLLVLRNPGERALGNRSARRPHHGLPLEIRQGVATGADATFIQLATLHPSSGRLVHAARGRDVAMNRPVDELPTIWVPPARKTRSLVSFVEAWPEDIAARLIGRFCVSQNQRPPWRFHESYPSWFLSHPKLLVPEVCTRISTIYDANGRVLPLHSTIAIRVNDATEARGVAGLLVSDHTWSWLRRRSPRMVNGAIRLTTPNLRELLAERAWIRRQIIQQ